MAFYTARGDVMKGTLTGKILKKHLVRGDLYTGGEIGIRIDQTLTQDATGTMVYLQFEAMGIDRGQDRTLRVVH